MDVRRPPCQARKHVLGRKHAWQCTLLRMAEAHGHRMPRVSALGRTIRRKRADAALWRQQPGASAWAYFYAPACTCTYACAR
eukprot:13873803-Alexandrium_andersonii.AAC.1